MALACIMVMGVTTSAYASTPETKNNGTAPIEITQEYV